MNAIDFCEDKLGTSTSKVMTRAERMEQLTKSLTPQELGWAIVTTSEANETTCITACGEYFNRIIIDGVDIFPADGGIMHTFEKAGPHLVYLGLDPETTTLEDCFWGCNNLKTLRLSNWKKDKITSTKNMFRYCKGLVSLDLGGWNTEKLQNAEDMFCYCASLTSLDLSGWNTENLHTVHGMFRDCESLTSLNLGGWNIACLLAEAGIFAYDYVHVIGNDKWGHERAPGTRNIFYNCNSLTSLDLSGWTPFVVEEIRNQYPNAVIKQ